VKRLHGFHGLGGERCSGARIGWNSFLLAVVGSAPRRVHAVSRVVAGSASRRAKPRVGVDVGRDDQTELRITARVHVSGAPPLWWGWVLIGIGLTSGVLGVLFALAQHDMKRLLAYHSVENIGIIALGSRRRFCWA